MDSAFFAISYAPALEPVFRVVGLGADRSGVWVDGDSVRVAMGWGFRADIPLRAVREIAHDSAAVTGWGVHGWRGRWLVNGSASGLVRLEMRPGVRGWVMGVPVQLRTLRLSLTAPDDLMSTLSNAR